MKVSEKEFEIIGQNKDLLIRLGDKYGWEPALLAAIVSRESRWGLLLDGNMKGDSGHGHGLAQIDDRSFGTWLATHDWKDPAVNLDMACRILQDKYNYLKQYVDEDWLDQYAVAAYNCGEGTMRKVWNSDEDVDSRTAGHNYSSDVFERMEEIQESGIFDGATDKANLTVQTVAVTGQDIVDKAMEADGKPYIFGYEVKLDDPDPKAFDCSELVQWVCHQLGVKPTMPDGAIYQYRHCEKHGTGVDLAQAIKTPGALLFRIKDSGNHVAISRGDGTTIEARGKDYGCGSWSSMRPGFTGAGRIPGVKYE